MHPIERLRAVARARWAGPAVLGAEAAWALAELAEREAPAVLPACRRLLDHHPDCGPLWWLAARVLVADDQVAEALRCGDALESDPTPDVLEGLGSGIDGGRVVRHGGMGEVVGAAAAVVGAAAVGHGGMIIDGDDEGLLEAAHAADVPLWVEGGVGRVLPAQLWDALAARVGRGGRAPTGRLVGVHGGELVVGPGGAQVVPVAIASADCPEPSELLARW